MSALILGEEFKWFNEPKNWIMENEKLYVTAEPRTDFFIDEETSSIRKNAHYFHTNVEGDFIIKCHVEVDMKENWDSACLMIYSDEKKWAKLCYENWPTGVSIVSVVTNNYSDDCPGPLITKNGVFLCIIRANNNFGFHYSIDNKNWNIARYFNMESEKLIKVGFAFQSPVGNGCNIVVDNILLTHEKNISAREVKNFT